VPMLAKIGRTQCPERTGSERCWSVKEKRLHALTRRLFAAVTVRGCGFAEWSREFRSTPKADIRLRFNIGRDGPICDVSERSSF
jgi:hypothetical protein